MVIDSAKGNAFGTRLALRHQTASDKGANVLQGYEARRGTVVRVREGHWKSRFAGMRGTVQNLWGNSEHAAVDVLLEDGRSELFWLPDLSVVDQDITV